MPWWPRRGPQFGGKQQDAGQDLVSTMPAWANDGALGTQATVTLPSQPVAPVTMPRVVESLQRLDIRSLSDETGRQVALWERHAVLFALEGPCDEILVMRARPHETVPPDWFDRAFRVLNEWNHTRRFCKAYLGDPTDRGHLPIYVEMQVPLISGVHDALLDELVECAAAVSATFVDWLHDEGALL